MHVLLISLILLLGLIIRFPSSRSKVNKQISIWAGIILFLYAGLRATTVGTDLSTYTSTYIILPNMSFSSLVTSTELIVSRDPIFYSFLKILTYISAEPQFMIIITSAIVVLSFSIFIYKNSLNPLMSFIMFIGLRYYSFTLTGIRQALAWSIILFAYQFIKEKKFIKFTLVVIVASLFHISAILFIFAYPLSKLRKIEKTSLIISLGFLFNFISRNLILKILVRLPALQQYETYIYSGEQGTTGLTMLLIYISILLLFFIFRRIILSKDKNIYLAYNLSILGVGIMTLSFSYANIFRIGYYFVFPIIILLPSVINNSFDKKSQLIANAIVITLLVAQFFLIGPGAGTENYQFFWNL